LDWFHCCFNHFWEGGTKKSHLENCNCEPHYYNYGWISFS
jgi:hypothetical protein